MDPSQHNKIVNSIWGLADDVLRDLAFFRREVLPHAADVWYDAESVRTGYEISFTRYFYKPQPLRTLEEIRADILALEKETEGLLAEIIGSGAA